jgi:hypothetical protein
VDKHIGEGVLRPLVGGQWIHVSRPYSAFEQRDLPTD